MIEELLKFSPTLGLLKVSSEIDFFKAEHKKVKGLMKDLAFTTTLVEDDGSLSAKKSGQK